MPIIFFLPNNFFAALMLPSDWPRWQPSAFIFFAKIAESFIINLTL